MICKTLLVTCRPFHKQECSKAEEVKSMCVLCMYRTTPLNSSGISTVGGMCAYGGPGSVSPYNIYETA